ncbi:MAG TPA: hypothetical protein VKM72_09050 [Thermoanaerobaculia bacterium]|nr:hypothetical protein [Thermoanaerobaculia bacterium]
MTLFLLGLTAACASAKGGGVGEVIDRKVVVKGWRGNDPKTDLKKGDPVFVGTEVQTFADAGARIAINTDLEKRKGVIILGPETQIVLQERALTEARRLKKLSWLIKLGQFRLALWPRDPEDPADEGQCLIYTAAGDLIELTGTDVVVKVDRDGTLTVWVIEGEVTVKAADRGEPVRVPAGHGTRVRPGREPEAPARFGPADGRPGPGPLPIPEETIFPDPPYFDLRDIRLDLPG